MIAWFWQANKKFKSSVDENPFGDYEQPSTASVLGVLGTFIGIAAGLLTESGTAIAAQLAKTGIGKAIAETAVGRVLGSVVPVIGPIITIVGIIGALGKFLGNNDDHAKLEAKLAAQNEAERRRVEAEMQARQELNQKCRYLADNLAGPHRHLHLLRQMLVLAVDKEHQPVILLAQVR